MTTAAAPAISPTSSRGIVAFLSIIGVLVLFFSIPFVLLLDGPMLGWLAGAVLFLGSLAVQRFVGRVTEGMDPTHAVGLAGISSIGRAMVVVLILFVIALQVDRTIGLVAGAVFAAAFTFDLLARTMIFAIREKDRKAAQIAADMAAEESA